MIASRDGASTTALRRLWQTTGLIIAATVCLIAGLVLPAVAFERFFFFGDEHSLLSAVGALWQAGEIPLALIIAVFSVVFPAIKLALMAADVLTRFRTGRSLHRAAGTVAWLGRWSMLDVFVLALIIVAIRGSGIGDAIALPGIYLFAMSVILTMWVGERLRSTADSPD